MDITTLPDPTLSFSLPSIHDGTSLDCRIYLPPSLLEDLSSPPPSPSSPLSPFDNPAKALPWQGNAAVVAHPYAPMGGNFNDNIVRLLTKTLLTGTPTSPPYVVATFNFRGAGHSNGRTSWTAKPETADYMTVAGFVAYFAHYLEPGTPTSPKAPKALNPKLLCCGYSYGALVTSLLPPVASVLAPFVSPLRNSPAAEVRRRAARWASIQNADFAAFREAAAARAKAAQKAQSKRLGTPPSTSPKKARLSMGIRVGTADDDLHHNHSHHGHGSPRRSHDVAALKHMLSPSPRRSVSADHRLSETRSSKEFRDSKDLARDDKTHHGVAGLLAKVRHRSEDAHDESKDKEEGEHMAVVELPVLQPAYLMVSPPVGIASNLATMTMSLPLFRRKEKSAAVSGSDDDADRKLATNPTLVVYGDADSFVSSKKIRQWTAKLGDESRASSNNSDVGFKSLEVATAGHFWAEGRTLYELQAAVAKYVVSLGA